MATQEYDDTEMTNAEFHAALAAATPVEVTNLGGTTLTDAPAVVTSSSGTTRSERVSFFRGHANRTITSKLELAGT